MSQILFVNLEGKIAGAEHSLLLLVKCLRKNSRIAVACPPHSPLAKRLAQMLQLWVQASRAGLKTREIPVPLIYHDTQRNFSGMLEDPNVRLDYYMSIIKHELQNNGSENAAKPGRS